MELDINTLTEKQKAQIDMGFIFSLTENWKLKRDNPVEPFNEDYLEFLKQEKKKNLNRMNLDSLITTTENFSDLKLTWKEKWILLSNKFFLWNVYKELQLHRLILWKLLKVVVKKEVLTEEDLVIIFELEIMDNNADIILDKL